MRIVINAPKLPPGVYGSVSDLVSTPLGPVLNVTYDPFCDAREAAHPITIGANFPD